MNRRRFLPLLGAAAAPSAAARTPLVAAHPWVYAAPRPEYDIYGILDGIFADMRYAGMGAIELMHTALVPDGASRVLLLVERIRELVLRHGLPVVGMSYSAAMWNRERHEAIVTEARRLIGRLWKVGGRTLGVSVGNTPRPKTPVEMDAQAEMVRTLMSICGDNDVVLNLHNHTYEVIDHEHDLRGTLARVPEVKLGPDCNWLLRAGIDPPDFIRRYGGRIVYAHLRDQKADGKWSEAMGEGVTDHAAIARALRETGFAGDLAIELAHERGFTPTRPLRESLKISREYVRKTMGY